MKKKLKLNLTVLFILFVSNFVFSQVGPIDFESGGNGANWTWKTFENGTDPALEIVPNPDASGINTSATVAKFTSLVAGAPYAGVESQHGADIGTFNLNSTNSTIKIMVYKTVISDVGIKFAQPNGGSFGELKVPNTKVNEWEEIIFDFSGKLQEPAAQNLDQIVVFPDFDLAGRATDNVSYFDNISFSGEVVNPGDGPTTAAPTPTVDAGTVLSIFSDAYTNVATVNTDPDWGQATITTEVEIAGNNTLKMTDFNYQGIDFGAELDVSGMVNLHLDYWTSDGSALNVFLISKGSGEKSYAVTLTKDEWVSLVIPLTEFSNQGLLLNDIYQFKFDGGGNYYLDNMYFSGGTIVVPPTSYNAPIDFETDGHGATWSWKTFENDTDPALEIVANPDASGINTSATVAKFTSLVTGAPYAGVESKHGEDFGTLNLDQSNKIVKIMVYKSVISDVGIKFAQPAGGSFGELKVPNTVINQWEELTFDFSSKLSLVEASNIDQIVVFPDFDLNGRATDNVSYFDNITFSSTATGVEKISESLPTTYSLEQNYPNPFNPSTRIRFNLSAAEHVTLKVYNLLGQEVATLINELKDAGTFEVTFDGLDLSSGTYVYSLSAGSFSSVKKMILIK